MKKTTMLISGWRRRAGYSAALLLTEKDWTNFSEKIEFAQVPKWIPGIRIAPNVIRRRPL